MRKIAMNIADAKAIPLDELLQRLGYQPAKQQGGRAWYRSPFRDEKTASFVLSKDGMAWYDHGEGVGGNIIDLAMRLGDCRDVPQALSWLDDATGHMAITIPTIRQRLPVIPEPPAYTVIDARPFSVWRGRSHSAGAQYLANQRGIDPALFAPYLQDVSYKGRDGRKQQGIGMPTVSGGFEVRRTGDWAKVSVGHKNVSAFWADRENAPWLCFYGMMDFGTFLTIDRPPIGAYNYLILNSDSMVGNPDEGPGKPERLGLAEQFLQGQDVPVGTMIHYPHNDASGQRAYHNLLSFLVARDWAGGDRAHLYEGFKDWNEKHQADKGIQKAPQAASIQAPASNLRQTPKF